MRASVARPTRLATLLAPLLLAMIAVPATADAQDNDTIYRCTDATGHLTVQNGKPCAKGSKQTMQVVEAPTVIPGYKAPPAIVTQVPERTRDVPDPASFEQVAGPPPVERPERPEPASIDAADRLPPPPIYRCETWENQSYLSEDLEPKPRCVRMQTTGLGGDPNNGSGEACEMKFDICGRVPDETACEGWKQRQREIESTWRFATADKRQPLQDEFARVTRILSDTTCGR